jgi:hypothetical protein
MTTYLSGPELCFEDGKLNRTGFDILRAIGGSDLEKASIDATKQDASSSSSFAFGYTLCQN